MKKVKFVAIVGAMLMSLNGYSQGIVSFANATAPVTSTLTGLPVTTGQIRVGLYYAAPGTPANPDGPVDAYRQAGLSANVGAGGIFFSGTRAIDGFAPGSSVSLQVRSWSQAFATYEEAYAAGLAGNTGALVGHSIVMLIDSLGGPGLPTPSLVIQGGLMSFAVSPVPEPSMIALSLLGGLGTLVLLRRRR